MPIHTLHGLEPPLVHFLRSGRRLAVFEITNMRVLDTLVFPLFRARLRDRDLKAQDEVMETIRPSPPSPAGSYTSLASVKCSLSLPPILQAA
jgi:hypothetical protein